MMRAELTESQIVPASASDFIDLSATPWRRITLSARDNIWCLVDAIDFGWLQANTWNVSWGSRTPWQFYAKRMIAADPRAEDFMAAHPVDHFNGQTLDNRRANLAWVTEAENNANRRPRAQIPSLESIVLQLMAEHGFAMPQEVPF